MSESLPLPILSGIRVVGDETMIENKNIKVCAEEKLELCGAPLKLNDLTWPSSDGSFNYVLSTNGAGQLFFQSIGSVSATDEIVNSTGTTRVQVENPFGSDTIKHTADSKLVLESTVDATTSYTPFYFDSRIEYKTRETTLTNDTILPSDMLIRWNGSASGTITLPLAGDYTGRPVIIENVSTFSLQIVKTGSDTIEGGTTPITLPTRYASVTVVGDGSSNWMIR